MQFLLDYPNTDRVPLVSNTIASFVDRCVCNYLLQTLDVGKGLEYLHSENIIHGDLKGVSGQLALCGRHSDNTAAGQYTCVRLTQSLPS